MPAYGGCYKELLDQLRAGDWDHAPPTAELDDVFKAIVGIASPLVSVITSLQKQIEWTQRVSSLVDLMSFFGMSRKMRRR